MAVNEIYLLHHTHVDVGYTDLQPVVEAKHIEYLGLVLDYCRQTDDYPDDARFRWISEFSWPVVRFLQACPDRAEELFTRIREGRIELAALYLDPTDLYDQRSFQEALRPSLDLAASRDFAVTVAMTSDIPGQGWGLVDVLTDAGIPYLSVSPNSMVSKPVLVERPFWWIGPRDGRVLVWRTDWRKGWYGEGHVLGFPQGFETARRNVLEYLDLLASEGYPWQVLALHFAADNYPPSAGIADLVRTWNDRGDLPRLRLATNREFFERLLELHGDSFPSYRAAWPDWWAEGLGSAAYEAALSRETHARLQRIEALQRRVGDSRDLWPIFDDLLMFDEHTWGCQSMALDPYSFNARASWAIKSASIYRAHDAARRLEIELTSRLGASASDADASTEDFRDATVRDAGPTQAAVTVHNPLEADFHGPVVLPHLASDVTALCRAGACTPPERGAVQARALHPVQRSLATPLAPSQYWAALEVASGAELSLSPVTPAPNAASPALQPGSLESPFYRLRHDARGRILSLIDAESGQELLDTRAPWAFGEVIHESIAGTQDREAVWERGYTAIPYGKRRTDAPFVRCGATAAELIHVEDGPLFASLTRRGELPYVRRFETEVRLWKPIKRIDVEVRLDKQPCEAYDSLYVAFPFSLDRPRAHVHSCGAAFEAEAEQLPGSCRDYYAVEHFVAFEDAARWALLAPIDAPLVQLGEFTFGRWADHLTINRACIYSWLLNNFWYTNFPGYQQGRLRFRYALMTGNGTLDLAAAERFGEAARIGLVVC